VLVLLTGGIYEVCLEMDSCGVIYISNFMKMDTGAQAVLGFGLGNVRGCNVGITGGRDL
jgi:hypothetical protein